MKPLEGEVILGAKGGSESKPRTPVEAPDSLHSHAYARILDLVSEGEIYGLVNGNSSIYLDETPLTSFSGVSVETRNGTQDQSYIAGFPAVESETIVGLELRSETPWTRSFTNTELSAVRIRLSTPRLLKQNPTNGDTGGYTVNYIIRVATDGGPYTTFLTSAFSGKTTTKYERSHRIDLPPAQSGWTVQVFRMTGNTATGSIADTMFVDAYTEIIDAKFRYPNSALIGLRFDAAQFSSIPPRAYHLRGRIIKVPTNYDPVTRGYTGIWDGTFKLAYTNNPAWIFYDLVLNERYGVGHLVNQTQVDKWSLYRIAQYCDGMISDGRGGLEPRFTCNMYLQTQAEVIKVLQDLASIFRGMSYWGGGQIFAVADMPEDPIYLFTNANVEDGKFTYSGTSRKSRYSVALVSWSDPADFCRAKVEYVEDRESLARFGHRSTSVTAFACTSQSQAQRLGRWILLTNRLEAETVNFRTGLDGALVRPGSIISVADKHRAGKRIGGRLRNATLTKLVLDAPVEVAAGDTVTVIMPSGEAVSRVVSNVSDAVTFDQTSITWDQTTLTFDTSQLLAEVDLASALPDIPPPQSVWALDSATLATQKFRVLAVKEDFTGDKLAMDVTATKHVTGKHAAIDSGVKIDMPPITSMPPTVQLPPAEVRLSSDYSVSQGLSNTTMRIEWDAAVNATAYEVIWRMNERDWVRAGRTGTTSIEVQGILAGTYQAKVQAFSALGIGSVWTTSIETDLEATTVPPSALASLTATSEIFGIKVAWTFPTGFEVQTTQRTELWYSTQTDLGTATKLGDYAYPQDSMNMMGLAAGVRFYFWARLVDKYGNIGPWTAMVEGTSSAEATEILDYLTGQITASELGATLLSEIDYISGTGPGSVNARLTGVQNTLQSQIASLESQMAELAGAPDYNPAETYAIDELVKYSGSIWKSIAAVPINTPPPNATYWTKVGDYASLGDMVTALAAEVDALETSVIGLDEDLTAEVTRINTLIAAVNSNAAAISNESSIRSTAITSLTNQLNTQTSRIDDNMSAISQESSTRSDQIGALSLQVDTVAATAQGAKTDAQNAADAAAQAAADAAAAAAGAESVLIQSTTPPVEKRLPGILWIDTTSNANTPKRWNGSAWVAITDKAATDAATAAANALTAANNANTTANQASASAQTASSAVATLDGKVSAQSSIKTAVTTGGRTYVAGIGVGVSNTSGIVESTVLVAASKFAVVDPNGTQVTSPFAIVGGQTFIQNAVIQNAAIDTLKIQGNAVTIPVAAYTSALFFLDAPNRAANSTTPLVWYDLISASIDTLGAPLDIQTNVHFDIRVSYYLRFHMRILINDVQYAFVNDAVLVDAPDNGLGRFNGMMPMSFTGPAVTGLRTVKLQMACQQVGLYGADISSTSRYMKLVGNRR